ncbi:hypothetical protein [Desulfuribacillus alkaliarsenatis]|uniref:Uncharacterized protein n=1 Tax=Desulfuribacillus alkaliarsenatis TaxID=766136 RepID=A0A1E5FZP9_9FIRM|nr:hypothetical protein [Desulfuribacillus alkaliarsenatis]OEF95973.1 hypothetical protein BHF68_09480 [Desulfuribacillus alkaliarsenatis]
MKIKRIVTIIAIIAVLGVYIYSQFGGKLSSQLSYAYNNDTELFTGEVVFEIFGFKKPTDVEVIVISPDNTVEFLSVEKQGKKYISEKYESIILNDTRPEFLISWKIDGKKNVEYVYPRENYRFFSEKTE